MDNYNYNPYVYHSTGESSGSGGPSGPSGPTPNNTNLVLGGSNTDTDTDTNEYQTYLPVNSLETPVNMVSNNHNNCKEYCNETMKILGEAGKKKGVSAEFLIERSIDRGNYFPCKAFHKPRNLINGALVMPKTPYDHTYKNPDPNVQDLVKVMNNFILNKFVNDKPTIYLQNISNKNACYFELIHAPIKLKYGDMKNIFNPFEDELFKTSIFRNKSHYQGFVNTSKTAKSVYINDDNLIFSSKLGYRIINTFQILGLNTAYSRDYLIGRNLSLPESGQISNESVKEIAKKDESKEMKMKFHFLPSNKPEINPIIEKSNTSLGLQNVENTVVTQSKETLLVPKTSAPLLVTPNFINFSSTLSAEDIAFVNNYDVIDNPLGIDFNLHPCQDTLVENSVNMPLSQGTLVENPTYIGENNIGYLEMENYNTNPVGLYTNNNLYNTTYSNYYNSSNLPVNLPNTNNMYYNNINSELQVSDLNNIDTSKSKGSVNENTNLQVTDSLFYPTELLSETQESAPKQKFTGNYNNINYPIGFVENMPINPEFSAENSGFLGENTNTPVEVGDYTSTERLYTNNYIPNNPYNMDNFTQNLSNPNNIYYSDNARK